MSGASEATTEQYFSMERSIARRALVSSTPTPEHQKEWFDDTMLYLAERYDALDEPQLAELRVLGERYCRPEVARSAPVGASA